MNPQVKTWVIVFIAVVLILMAFAALGYFTGAWDNPPA
jgi:hypothetical protein